MPTGKGGSGAAGDLLRRRSSPPSGLSPDPGFHRSARLLGTSRDCPTPSRTPRRDRGRSSRGASKRVRICGRRGGRTHRSGSQGDRGPSNGCRVSSIPGSFHTRRSTHRSPCRRRSRSRRGSRHSPGGAVAQLRRRFEYSARVTSSRLQPTIPGRCAAASDAARSPTPIATSCRGAAVSTNAPRRRTWSGPCDERPTRHRRSSPRGSLEP